MLKYYEKEKQELPKEATDTLTHREATYVFDRLKSRYKFRQTLYFYGHSGSGKCSSWRIRISNKPDIIIIAHEVAHAIQYKKRNYYNRDKKRWHNKEHLNIMKRVTNVILNNIDAWRQASTKKQQIKSQTEARKVEKIKELKELRKSPQHKLLAIQKRIKAWESKKKKAETRLKKLKRREKIYLKKVKEGG